MTITLRDALEECRRIRMDLTNAQAKLTDVISALSGHPDSSAPPLRCPDCGSTFRGPLALAEHVYNSHGGPLPAHYVAAERRAGFHDSLDEDDIAVMAEDRVDATDDDDLMDRLKASVAASPGAPPKETP